MNEAQYRQSLLNLKFDSDQREMENEVTSSQRILEITKNDIVSRLKSFHPLEDAHYLNESIQEAYNRAVEHVGHAREDIEKRVSTFQEEARDRLNSLNALASTPQMSSRKVEIDQLILDIKEKMLEITEASKRSLAELQHLEAEILKMRNETFNEMNRKIKVIEESKNDARQLLNVLAREFDDVGFIVTKTVNDLRNRLEVLKLGIPDNILNGTENSLQYALRIRSVVDEGDNVFLSQRQRVEMIEKNTLQKLREMYDSRLIDVEFFANSMATIRKQREAAGKIIDNAANTSSDFSLNVFDELQEASTTRNRREFEEQMSLHANRIKEEIKAEMDREALRESARALQQEIVNAMRRMKSIRTWLQDTLDVTPHRMNNDLDYIRGNLEIIKASIEFTLNKFDSIRDTNYQKENIQASYEKSIRQIQEVKEAFDKKISAFSIEAKRRLKILNTLAALPQMSSKKNEIDQLIYDINEKILEVGKASEGFSAELRSFETEMLQIRDQAIKEIDHRCQANALSEEMQKEKPFLTKYQDGQNKQKGQPSKEIDQNNNVAPIKPQKR